MPSPAPWLTRAKRIDYYSGAIFSIARIPGAILGALTTFFISRPLFDLLIGVLMLAASGFLFWRPSGGTLGTAHNPAVISRAVSSRRTAPNTNFLITALSASR